MNQLSTSFGNLDISGRHDRWGDTVEFLDLSTITVAPILASMHMNPIHPLRLMVCIEGVV